MCLRPSGQISARRFRVVGVDVHRFDSDGDGIACEGSR
ncbi:MAG: excalibur calcium-binding domain-containing protein [Miltoncostaeaceae bacterium]